MQSKPLVITMTFQRMVTTPLTLCLSPGVHFKKDSHCRHCHGQSCATGSRGVHVVTITRRERSVTVERDKRTPLPGNYGDFIHEQNGHGCQRDPCGQCVTSEEVQGHPRPAGASGY